LLLKEEQRLYLQSAGPGSWYVTALSKVKGAGTLSLQTLSLMFSEGRTLLIERVRLGNEIKREELRKHQIDNYQAASKVVFYIANKIDKIIDKDRLEDVRNRLSELIGSIRNDDKLLLPPPKQ
jgi:hypothetical protein